MIDILGMMHLSIVTGNEKFYFGENCLARLTLWVRRPNNIMDMFVCYKNHIFAKTELWKKFTQEKITIEDFYKVLANNYDVVINKLALMSEIVTGREELYISAMPYIEDGYVEIAGNPNGPWINLMPNEG